MLFGNSLCKRNRSARIETYCFAARRHDKIGKIDGLSPIFRPVADFMIEIRRSRIDLNQTGSEKLNWIERPGTA